jgi:hypothetical protein
MSTLKAINLVHPTSATNNIVLDASGNAAVGGNLTVTGAITGSGTLTTTGTVVMGSSFMRNRIINGAMVVDQRNVGASVAASGQYTLDRWVTATTVASKFNVQQNAGAVTPPVGFSNYLGVTSSSAYSILTGDILAFAQYIEAFNTSDLEWGTANAQAITLSFWVRSSLTGTFGGALQNSAQNRSYPFSFTVSSANTWEQKSVTIAGDTAGTWVSGTNGVGVRVFFSVGTGATYSGTAGSWSGNQYYGPTGATSVVGTNGATFYITGVQLEVGTVATPFEREIYSETLAKCQRYYEKCDYVIMNVTSATSGASYYLTNQFKVTKRASPTLALGPSASWSGATAALFSGTEVVQLYNGTTQFYIAGTAGIVAITASAEL